MQIPRWDRVPRHPQGGVGKLLSATFNGLSHIDGDCAVEVVAGGAGILGGIQMTFFDLHGQIGTVVGKMFSGGVSFGIGGGKWNAVVSQGIVTLYAYTITAADSAHSNVYYYSMSASTPPNFHNAPAPSFRVFNYPAKGAVPVYMFTIQMNDSVGTLVYYYSLSVSTPPNFNGPYLAFYAYPTEQEGAGAVHLFTGLPSDGTLLYYYSSVDDQPPGFTDTGVAFWAPALRPPPT